ncbi:MAG: TIGR01777 family oxidoreductase [Flavobacteriales bacterium]|nr:TIGR01777 family oxidoreductase [Flavobacteriales bacterium]
MATILITGGSGLVGSALTPALQREGHSVRWLSREAGTTNGVRRHAWDITRGTIDAEALDGVDHVIHLSGAGIADNRWSEAWMRELYLSRGGAARLLLKKAQEAGARPKSFISASGIGYYGAVTTGHLFKESDPAGTDAIGRLTKDWEDAADEWAPLCRVVKLRTPMVLARDGGALKRLSATFRLGLGAALGTGQQWMPWIHIDDLVTTYARAVDDEHMNGAYNVVADEQPHNTDFMREVAKVLRRPFFLPNVPAFALRLAFGELSVILLEGSRASGERLAATGIRFRHTTLGSALQHALRR